MISLFEIKTQLNMKATTKYDIGDRVWSLRDNRAVKNIVFQAKESKSLTGSDADIEGLIKELLDEKIIG